MNATLVKHEDDQVTIQFTVTLTGQMLNDEQALQDSLNAAGQIAMAPIPSRFYPLQTDLTTPSFQKMQ